MTPKVNGRMVCITFVKEGAPMEASEHPLTGIVTLRVRRNSADFDIRWLCARLRETGRRVEDPVEEMALSN